MTDRERLIELLYGKSIDTMIDCEYVADYLLENGVVVPPCKVGQEVWFVYTPKFPANPADKGKWFMTQDGVQRIILGVQGFSIETWNVGTIPAKEIGKKLFLTREEAEKALAERQEGVNND